jgi:protein SCO1/2
MNKAPALRTVLLVLAVTIAALAGREIILSRFIENRETARGAGENRPDILGPSPYDVAEKAVGKKLEGPYPFFDQDGKPFDLAAWFDKPMVISYIFTECPMVCPTISQSLADFVKSGFVTLGAHYRIVTVGFDPANDKPAAMKAFGGKFTSDFSSWRFVSGSPEVVKRLSEDIGIMYMPDDQGAWKHTMGVTILAAGGKVSSQLSGMAIETPDLLAKLKEAGVGK